MTDFELELEGLQNVIESLNDLEADLDSDTSWLVGTAVEYSVVLPSLNRTNSGKRYVTP